MRVRSDGVPTIARVWRRILVVGLGVLLVASAIGVYSYGAEYGWWARPTVKDAPEVEPSSVETIASGMSVPFDLAFLPDGSALMTERESGRLLRVTAEGRVTEVRTIEEMDENG